jgi:hypothetical protein
MGRGPLDLGNYAAAKLANSNMHTQPTLDSVLASYPAPLPEFALDVPNITLLVVRFTSTFPIPQLGLAEENIPTRWCATVPALQREHST